MYDAYFTLLHYVTDEHIKEEVGKWRENLGNYSEEIGKTSVYLNGTSQACRFRECNMGNLLCDAVVRCFHRYRWQSHLRVTLELSRSKLSAYGLCACFSIVQYPVCP